MSIFEAIARWRSRGKFAKLVPPEVVSSLLESRRSLEIPVPKLLHFHFILVQIRDGDTAEIPELTTKVVETFMRRDAFVTDITSSLVVGYFGIPNPKYGSTEDRAELVAALLAENGNAVRIAHGECNGLVGSFGTKARRV